MGLCFKIIEIWNLFDILDFVYWNFWFIQVRVLQKNPTIQTGLHTQQDISRIYNAHLVNVLIQKVTTERQ